MANKYLEKIAEESKKPGIIRTTAEAGAGAYALSKVPQRMLGYHTVYHGTSKDRANSINREGYLNPKHGGSGAASHIDKTTGSKHEATSQSSGKVHVTKSKQTAKFFAGYTEHADKNPATATNNGSKKLAEDFVAGFKNQITGRKGEVLKSRVSHGAWEKDFEKDPHMSGPKSKAATTTKKVKLNRPIKDFATMSNLKKYYGSKSGRINTLKGVGLALGGGALMAHAITKRIGDGK